MQALPAPAQSTHGCARGRDRERHEQQERGESGGDVGALHDVGEELGPVECLVHQQIPEEMQRDVEEREQSQHAPEQEQPRPAEERAQRGHRERRQQQSQAPDAERVLDLFDGVGPQPLRGRGGGVARLQGDDAGGEPRRRQQAQEENDRLHEAPERVIRVH